MRTTNWHNLLLGLAFSLLAGCTPTQTGNPVAADREAYNRIGRFDSSQLANHQDTIRVEGNQFVDGSGKTFIFRGVSIADPDKLVRQGKWHKSLFAEIMSWGANTIRLPVHPRAWREQGRENYLALLDQAVVWANALDLYLIVDWHSIGFLETGAYQHLMYVTDKQESFRFWHDIAFRYQGVPTMAVYELFNEPTTLEDPWGDEEWLIWKDLNETMIDIIYAIDRDVIPLAAGFNWAYDLTPLRDHPIERDGISYACHPYPQKAKPEEPTDENFIELWEQTWGFAAQTYPLICTEMGWVQPDGYGAHNPVKDDGSYGPRIIQYLNERGISWIAWVFDPHWSPTLINNWNFEPSEQGEFFRDVMREN